MAVLIGDIPFYIILFIGLYFQIFLLITLVEKNSDEKQQNTDAKKQKYPSVAITIPCFNEQKTLRGTVLSLLALEYPKNRLEIIIVDDGSTDNTLKVAKKLQREFPQVKVFNQKNGGKYTALNFGLKQSSTDLVGCLDADSFVDREALKRMISYFNDQTTMAVTPAICVHDPKNVLQKIQKAEYNAGVLLKQILGKLNAIHVTPGPFSIFRRSVFTKLGGYKHAHNTEDMEIACRMQTNHFKIRNCPTAYVYTVTPDTIKKLHRQRVRWIYGFFKNALDYKHLFFNRKYGNLGVLTLPLSAVFLFTSLYIAAMTFKTIVDGLAQKIVEIETVGLQVAMPSLNFDLFFIRTETLFLLSTLALVFTISFMLLGKKMAEGTMKPGLDLLYFFCFYGFISPFWVLKALFNTAFSRKTTWR